MQELDYCDDERNTDALTAVADPVLAELWDNDEDAMYDDWPAEMEPDHA